MGMEENLSAKRCERSRISSNVVKRTSERSCRFQRQQPGTLASWLLEAREADISTIVASLQTTVMFDNVTHYRLKAAAIEGTFLVCTYSVS
jgi:hypothetical protein